jgi:hypothetical protein
MKSFSFRLISQYEAKEKAAYLLKLSEGNLDDCSPYFGNNEVELSFSRISSTLWDAIESAIDDVKCIDLFKNKTIQINFLCSEI